MASGSANSGGRFVTSGSWPADAWLSTFLSYPSPGWSSQVTLVPGYLASKALMTPSTYEVNLGFSAQVWKLTSPVTFAFASTVGWAPDEDSSDEPRPQPARVSAATASAATGARRRLRMEFS